MPRARTQAAQRLTSAAAGLASSMERLRKRSDFLAAATGGKVPTAGFVLQARARAESGPVRIGFTVSRKVGNAVERNRVRRLQAANDEVSDRLEALMGTLKDLMPAAPG